MQLCKLTRTLNGKSHMLYKSARKKYGLHAVGQRAAIAFQLIQQVIIVFLFCASLSANYLSISCVKTYYT